MKKLSRKELKATVGGAQKFEWSCYSASDGGYVLTCSDVDPTAHCATCGYSDCSMTGTKCSSATICVC